MERGACRAERKNDRNLHFRRASGSLRCGRSHQPASLAWTRSLGSRKPSSWRYMAWAPRRSGSSRLPSKQKESLLPKTRSPRRPGAASRACLLRAAPTIRWRAHGAQRRGVLRPRPFQGAAARAEACQQCRSSGKFFWDRTESPSRPPRRGILTPGQHAPGAPARSEAMVLISLRRAEEPSAARCDGHGDPATT